MFLATTPAARAQESPPTTTTAPAAEQLEADACANAPEVLRVATKPIEPFVFAGENPHGFSIDLWQAIAGRIGSRTEWIHDETPGQVIDSVANDQADVGIAALSITPERAERVDFSVPMYTSGLKVLTPREDTPSTFRVFEVLSLEWFVRFLAFLCALLLGAGIIVWLIERRSNPDFHKGIRGIPEGMWWAVVTMATVGYGDRVARTHLGRLFSAMWIILGILVIAEFTATVTARLTVDELSSNITGLDSLVGADIITVQGTAGADLLREQGIHFREVPSVDEMVSMVANRQAEAAVFDGPVLQYQADNDNRVEVSSGPLTLDYYGIAVAKDSELRGCIDEALLEVIDDGTWQKLHDGWFGEATSV